METYNQTEKLLKAKQSMYNMLSDARDRIRHYEPDTAQTLYYHHHHRSNTHSYNVLEHFLVIHLFHLVNKMSGLPHGQYN